MFSGINTVYPPISTSINVLTPRIDTSSCFRDLLEIWPQERPRILALEIDSKSLVDRKSRLKFFSNFLQFLTIQIDNGLPPQKLLLCLKHAYSFFRADEMTVNERILLIELAAIYYAELDVLDNSTLKEVNENIDSFCKEVMHILCWGESASTQDEWVNTSLLSLLQFLGNPAVKSNGMKCSALVFYNRLFANTPFPISEGGFSFTLKVTILTRFLETLKDSLPSDRDVIYTHFINIFHIDVNWIEEAILVCKTASDNAKNRAKDKRSIDFLEVYGRVVELGDLILHTQDRESTQYYISRICLELMMHIYTPGSVPTPFERIMTCRLSFIALESEKAVREKLWQFRGCIVWCEPDFYVSLALAQATVMNPDLSLALFTLELLLARTNKNLMPSLERFHAVLRCLRQFQNREGIGPNSFGNSLILLIKQFISRGFSLDPVEYALYPRLAAQQKNRELAIEHYFEEITALIWEIASLYGLDSQISPAQVLGQWIYALRFLLAIQIHQAHFSDKVIAHLEDLLLCYYRRWLDCCESIEVTKLQEILNFLIENQSVSENGRKTLLVLLRKPFRINEQFFKNLFKRKAETRWQSASKCMEYYCEPSIALVRKAIFLYNLGDFPQAALYHNWIDAITHRLVTLAELSKTKSKLLEYKNDLLLCLDSVCSYQQVYQENKEALNQVVPLLERIKNLKFTEYDKEPILIRKNNGFYISKQGVEDIVIYLL